MKQRIYILLMALCSLPVVAQNRPYIDDKLIHFGFSLGVNFMHYTTPESDEVIEGEQYNVSVSGLMPGFSVGFITDLRLARHLNLRFCPALHFGTRTLTYKPLSDPDRRLHTDVLSLPITIPLYLKWSAEREMNYRPYLIAGGGVSFDLGTDKKKAILQKPFDYFVEVGFGCDFYFDWFKFCPQLTYSIGFNNVLTPADQRPELASYDEFYTRALSKLLQRQITLTFNFE